MYQKIFKKAQIELSRFKCQKKNCPLRDSCRNVPHEKILFNPKRKNEIDLMIVGEAPGREENSKGRPFIGKSGRLLRNGIGFILSSYDWAKEFKPNICITNVVKARPTTDTDANRTPTKQEIEACSWMLEKEIERYKPKLIIAMGNTSGNYLYRELSLPVNNILVNESCIRKTPSYGKVMLSLHPSFFLRAEDQNSVGLMMWTLIKGFYYLKEGYDFRISNKFRAKLVNNVKDLESLLERIKNHKMVAIDTECSSLNRVYDNVLYSIQLSYDGKIGYTVLVDHKDNFYTPKERKKLKTLFKDFFNSYNGIFVFHNAVFDMHMIATNFDVLNLGGLRGRIIDTQFNERLLDENLIRIKEKFPKGLGPYSLALVSYKHGFDKYLTDETMKKEIRTEIGNMAVDKWINYASADAVVPFRLEKVQRKKAKISGYTRYLDMSLKYNTMLSKVIVYTERGGIKIDINRVRELASPETSPFVKILDDVKKEFAKSKYVKKLEVQLKKEKYGQLTPFAKPSLTLFNPSSKIHKDMLFFDIMKLKPIDDKKSTDKEFQEHYKDIKEVELLNKWNRTLKLKSTYVDKVITLMNKRTGNPDFYKDYRIRPRFSPDAVTGRLASKDPNTQQIVARGEGAELIQSMFVAPKGRCIIKVDYSTFEVRGLGIVSRDRNIIDLFKKMNQKKKQFIKNWKKFIPEQFKDNNKLSKNELMKIAEEELELETDFHKRSASLFMNKNIREITKNERSNIKEIVFGSIYGRTVPSIAKKLGISNKEAQKLFNKFFEVMPEAKEYLERVHKMARKFLIVESPIGRRRHLWGYLFDWSDYIIEKMNRLGPNSEIQGFCSDMNVITTFIMFNEIVKRKKLPTDVGYELAWLIINLVHDSLEIEVPIKDIKVVPPLIKEVAEVRMPKFIKKVFGYDLIVPVEIDVDICLSYDKKYKKSWNGIPSQLQEIEEWAKQTQQEMFAKRRK